jgi:hypothetical protein
MKSSVNAFGFALVLSAILLTITSCGANPRHQSLRMDIASSVQFINFPSGAEVFVDGVNVVPTNGPRGSMKIVVQDGMREIRVNYQGNEIHSSRIFIQDGTVKQIQLPK